MTNGQTTTTTIVIGVLIILVVIFGAIYFTNRARQPVTAPTPSEFPGFTSQLPGLLESPEPSPFRLLPSGGLPASPAQPPVAIPSDWGTYTDPSDGFSFAYPAAWQTGRDAQGNVVVQNAVSASPNWSGALRAGQIRATFRLVNNPANLSPAAWAQQNSGGAAIVTQTPVNVGGQAGLKVRQSGAASPAFAVYVPYQNKMLTATWSAQSDTIFNQILATISFT